MREPVGLEPRPLRRLVEAMPKAELHLHLDGSLRIDTALELARTRRIEAPRTFAAMYDALVAPEQTESQAELLQRFDLPIALLQDADAHVRLEALLALSELPGSARAAAALGDIIASPENARDPWIPDAVAMAGVKQGPDFLAALLKRRVPGDSLAVVGMQRAVAKIARYHAGQQDAGAVVELIRGVPGATPQLAVAMLNGLADGWPQESPPTLSVEQRAALSAAGRGASGDLEAAFAKLAARWGLPTVFK